MTHTIRSAAILSGVALSREIRRRAAMDAQMLSRPPRLVVVVVGDRPDSHRYVRHKAAAAAECGFDFRLIHLPESVSQNHLHKELVAVNSDNSVDGVLLQLPLPPHLRARAAVFHIHPGKDVDGLHPLNAGNLFLRDSSPLADAFVEPVGPASSTSTSAYTAAAAAVEQGPHAGRKLSKFVSMVDESLVVATHEGSFSSIARRSHERKFFIPCTALAVRSLLVSYLSKTESFFRRSSTPSNPKDLHAVIVNTSMVVGVPIAALLQKERGFTVTMCNRGTPLDAIKRLTQTADVLVTAYGKANVFDRDFVKEGAIVIDVAINEAPEDRVGRTPNGTQAKPPIKLYGDVDFTSVKEVARAITPVPGGVGPLTVAHLMQNVLKAAQLRQDTRLYYNNVYASFVKMYGASSPSALGGGYVAVRRSPERVDPLVATADATAQPDKPAADEDEEEVEDYADNGSYDC